EAHEPVELLEDGRHDDLARLGPRAVADADRDRPPPAHDLAQWRAGDGTAQRVEHRRPLVVCRARVERLHNGRALLGEVDSQAVAAVRERDLHGRVASNSGGVYAST